MFWIVLTVVTGCLCVLYAAIAVWGDAIGIARPRSAKFGRSVWGLVAWSAICVWHVLHLR